MKTTVVRMTEEAVDETAIAQAGKILREGGLVAFPTETVYGLGGDAFNPESAKRIYAAKGRPSDNPLIVHIARMEDLDLLAKEVPEAARRLAEAFWPGPLTLIFPKKDAVPAETTGGLSTVAVRFPSNRIAQALIRAAGGFVAAPSANRSGRPSPTLAKHCIEDLDGRADMIIDGGEVGIGLESTIVDVSGEKPEILRPGFLTRERLHAFLQEEVVAKELSPEEEQEAPRAPGMKYRHYAPQGEMALVCGEPEAVADRIRRELAKAAAEGKRTGVLCAEESAGSYAADLVISLGERNDPAQAAKRLFAALRSMDEEGIDCIFAEALPEEGVGKAVMNRLRKAAGGQEIKL